MGFYDCRCMLTGVSLMPVDATLVVLQRVGGDYLPITLGIKGTYDRFGGIDGVLEDLNTELVLRYFVDRYSEGRFFADDQTSTFDGDALTADSDIEDLIRLIERTHLAIEDDGYSPSTVLDGNAIVFALIAQPVWDAIAATAQGPLDRAFERLFGPTSVAAEVYAGRLPELAAAIGQLAAVVDFVETNGLRWAPAPEPAQRYPTDYGCQHGDDEVRSCLARAKSDFRDDSVIASGLAGYEQAIGGIVDVSGGHAFGDTNSAQMAPTSEVDSAEISIEPVQFAVRVYSDDQS